MRIAITNPTTWPHLKRGVERFINELAVYLSARGHEVTIVAGKPGKTEVVFRDGFTTVYRRRLWHPWFQRLGILEFHAFFFPALAHLLTHRYDIVFCCTFMDGLAAKLARYINGTPYTFTCFALPPKVQHFRSITLKGAIFKHTIFGANAFLTISNYVSDYFKRRWGMESQIQYLPVDMARFRPAAPSAGARPTILCAAAINDPRKGGRILMRAFDRLKQKYPDLQLQIAWTLNPELQREFSSLVSPCWRDDIHFLGTEVNLPELFSHASISVLPSLWESQGLVVLESLAAGTPVVCTRDGALPEILTDPAVGRLFDPGPNTIYEPTNLDGMVQAMEEALALSVLPETTHNCRAYAERFSWNQLGPLWENLLRKVSESAIESATPAECGR